MIENENSIIQHVLEIKNEIMINENVISKGIIPAKKDFNWNISTCIWQNSRYLKSILNDSTFVCDEIINVTESVSTNVTITKSREVTSAVPTNATSTMPTNVISTLSTNVTSSVPVNSDNEKVIYKIVIFCTRLFYWPHYYLWWPLFAIIMQSIGQNKTKLTP